MVQHVGAESRKIRIWAASPKPVNADQPGALWVAVARRPGVTRVIALVVVPARGGGIALRCRVAALERKPFEAHRGVPRGLDRGRYEGGRGRVKRARRSGPTVPVEFVRRRDLLAHAIQVAGAGVAVRPTHRGEEESVDGAPRQTREAGVRIAPREPHARCGCLFAFRTRAFAPGTMRPLGGDRFAPRKQPMNQTCPCASNNHETLQSIENRTCTIFIQPDSI